MYDKFGAEECWHLLGWTAQNYKIYVVESEAFQGMALFNFYIITSVWRNLLPSSSGKLGKVCTVQEGGKWVREDTRVDQSDQRRRRGCGVPQVDQWEV
jgi:hypothetical protein